MDCVRALTRHYELELTACVHCVRICCNQVLKRCGTAGDTVNTYLQGTGELIVSNFIESLFQNVSRKCEGYS
jgi:hypothetical protein